ncbi:hypothetical protein FisN_7Lh175 [Fistulifera solaris]|uniref:Uncharacterized protein n=1 Tax=Fistulifera solaris TaxID=1519565 RepID=A0A1Z5JDF2_FISSO|nr:hypothetical protein FisN_7Lh175 [Fistulifera solaris]|eukprot:GAX11791.1 hypothetical protein FisN_7Lh175 [Fistulifera solaris]
MIELRRLRGYSETLLHAVHRRLEEDAPESLQGQPIDLSVNNIDNPGIFGAQQGQDDDENDNKELFIYLAIIAMVSAFFLCTCVIVTMIIRSTLLQKKIHVKSSKPSLDTTNNLPHDSASSVMDSAASRSTATGGKSVLTIPLPVSLMNSKKEHHVPKDLSVAVLADNVMPPRAPVTMPPESSPTKERKVPLEDGIDDEESPPKQYSPSMRLLLEQVETLSSKPGQVHPISMEQNGTTIRREPVYLTEL